MKSLPARHRRRVEAATVTIERSGGRGVFMKPHVVVTAAHCLAWDVSGRMTLDDDIVEYFVYCGERFPCSPLSVDPVADLASLGQPAPQELLTDWMLVWDRQQSPEPLSLFDGRLPPFERMPVFMPNSAGSWLRGEAYVTIEGADRAMIEFAEPVQYGDSGSPIVDEQGRLVALMSNTSDEPIAGRFCGRQPLPGRALPVWLAERAANWRRRHR